MARKNSKSDELTSSGRRTERCAHANVYILMYFIEDAALADCNDCKYRRINGSRQGAYEHNGRDGIRTRDP
ncbi:MAG: hypothetical protein J4400_05360 [Candidatus Aenigmarchaeota archaeon]|nr:hypothetical protein [Candidatus Aenigmarchaeota archaeon]